MPIVLLESGGVAPRPPGLGACKSHKSTIGIAIEIQALAPGVWNTWPGHKNFFGEGGPSSSQAICQVLF